MTTPSEKPTWLDRYTMIGDTIPMSRTAGGGGGSNRVFVDFGDTPSYPVDTRFHAFQEPATSGAQNRPHWALAEGLAWLYERELAQPYVQAGTTSGPTAGIPIASSIVYLGELGYTTSDIPKVADLLDGNWDELHDESVPPNHIIGSDYQVYDPINATWVSCYPGGGLPTDTASAPISGVGSPDNYSITTSLALTGSATGVSVMNYDKWLREIRDAGSPEDAFATIVDWTDNQSFKVHRDITGGGLDWAASDTLFVSHFAYVPSLVAAPTVPSGQGYNFAVGIHSTLGRLEKNAITSLKVRTAEAVPFDVEKFILGGLDAAYDQLGFGTSGGGRVTTVDAGAVEAQIAAAGQIGFRSWVPTGDYFGTIGFMGQIVGGTESARTNFLSGVLFAVNDPGGSRVTLDNSCTGNASGGLTLVGASAQFQSGTDYTIFPGHDMMVVYDSGGDPVTGAGSPEGIYIIEDITGTSTADLLALDLSTPDLSNANTCSILRPVFTSVAGKLDFEAGATGNRHYANVFTSYATGAREAAIELNSYHEHTNDLESSHLKTYINTNRTSPLLTLGTHHYGDLWSPSFVYGVVSPTYAQDNVLESWLWYSQALPGLARHITDFTKGSNGQSVELYFNEGATPALLAHQFLPYGESLGLGTGPASSSHSDVVIMLGAATSDYVHLGATYASGAGATYPAAGFWVGYRDGAAPACHFKLRGYPNSPTAPADTTADTVSHRFEVNVNAAIGYSDWRTIQKIVPMVLGDSGTATPNWTLVDDGSAPAAHYWNNSTNATGHFLSFPLLVPHGCEILKATCRFYESAAVGGGTAAKFSVIRVDMSAAVGGGSSAVIAQLDSSGSISMDPGVGSTTTYSYPAAGTCDQNTVVDLETYEYYAQVESAILRGAGNHQVLQITIQFRYADIQPE